MLVVLEGVDGTGKTTLAREVAAELMPAKTFIFHSQAPNQHPTLEYVSILKWYARGENNVVLDRFHLGEEVYGPLYREGSGLGDHGFRAVEDVLLSLGAILVYCTGSTRKIAQRLEERDGEKVDQVKLRRELHAFDQIVGRSRLPKIFSPIECPVTAREVLLAARPFEVTSGG